MKDYISKYLKKVFDLIRKNQKLSMIIVIIILLCIMYFSIIKNVLILILLVFLSAISKLYHRLFKNYLGIDFVLFSCVAASFMFGWKVGMIVGWISLILADYFGNRLSHTSLISLITLVIISFIPNIITGQTFFVIGIVSTFTFEVIAAPLYMLMGSDVPKTITFLSSHFLFNLIIFMNLSNFIIR
ncbi:hypothetical protein HOD20_01625 [archaeon]|nr:hypothetical protein [archaeon]